MGLNTYMQTATCTQRTEVLVLELKHYERLLVKRNRRTIDGMKDDLELRLHSRAPSYHMSYIPLLSYLQVNEYTGINV